MQGNSWDLLPRDPENGTTVGRPAHVGCFLKNCYPYVLINVHLKAGVSMSVGCWRAFGMTVSAIHV